jgi:hypothetical protein
VAEIILHLISSGFWDITQHIIFFGQCFETPFWFHLLGLSDKREYWDGVGVSVLYETALVVFSLRER